jgi:hypothetical protein
MLRYNIPDGTSIEVVADWVELYVTFLKDSISKTQLESYVQSSTGDEPVDGFIDSVWEVLKYRTLLYGITPPFIVEPSLVSSTIDWELFPEYLTCLIYSLEGNPNTPSASAADAGKYFERISNEAIRNYMKGDSLIYGFPSDQSIEDIANLILKEKFNHQPPSYRKDRDLDIIAWKPWGDNRASQIILFVQCAAGGNWKTKIKDLNIRAWEKYIDFAAPLLKGFSVPVIISDKELLNEISTDAGVIIDRPRLYRETYNIPFSDLYLRSTLLTWCNSRITELNN